MTVTRRIRSPGRARNKPLKPLRAGMPGDLGCTCGDYARVPLTHFAREAMGAAGTRHSPRPLFFGAKDSCTTRAHRAPRECGGVFAVIARSACDEAIHSHCALAMDCFASLAMTILNGCLKMESACVVPANAGTHTPRTRVLAGWPTPSVPTDSGDYGSLRSQGRH